MLNRSRTIFSLIPYSFGISYPACSRDRMTLFSLSDTFLLACTPGKNRRQLSSIRDKRLSKPLEGIRVLELGQLIAGPFAGTMLAYFGAEVIKIEPPNGDPLRKWRMLDEKGTSLWWRSMSRNKKCITVNLKTTKGQSIVKQLASKSQVLIENFRPGKMEALQLGPSDIASVNPALIYARVSGYGQDGRYSHKPGFASVAEAFAGLRYINGFPDQPSVRPNISLGDTLAALHTTIGILLALVHQSKTQLHHMNKKSKMKRDSDSFRGEVVDVAIYESIFNCLESIVPEYDYNKTIRGPSGSTVTGITPTNTYPCGDGKYVVIGANGDAIFKRLMIALNREDIANDPLYSTNERRNVKEKEIDNIIEQWTLSLSSKEVLVELEMAGVPSGPIYNVEDMFNDGHFKDRNMLETVYVNGKPLKIPGMSPKLKKTPGSTEWAGMELGAHNEEVFQNLLGFDSNDIKKLKEDKAI